MQVVHKIFASGNAKIIHAYESHVSSCDDCKVCHYKPSCKFNDDMKLINEILDQIDTLVIASPIYFGGLSDQLMTIINRFQPYFEKKFTHKLPVPIIKNIYLISTCASKSHTMFDGPNVTLNILKDLFSATNTNTLTLTNTDDLDDIVSTYQNDINAFKSTIKKELT